MGGSLQGGVLDLQLSVLPGFRVNLCRKHRKEVTVWVTWSNVVLLQSVLGALISVNLKNSLKQLTDPYYLWKKNKLDCVGTQPHPCSPRGEPRPDIPPMGVQSQVPEY